MPETMSVERRKVMKALGANLVLTEGAKGMKGAVDAAEALLAEAPEQRIMLQQFNNPANPLNMMYGTLALIIFLYVYYNHAQAFLIASTSLKQISSSFDEASTMLGGGVVRTFFKVTLPLLWPTLLGVGVFFFMRAMVSLSAVIFLITPETGDAPVNAA